jgi:hypothetical protein
LNPQPALEVPPLTMDTLPEAAPVEPVTGKTPDTASATKLPEVPETPFAHPAATCVTIDGHPVLVDGFPSSPYVISPFQEPFANPTFKESTVRACREDGHCMDAYTIDVFQFQVSLSASLPALVWVMPPSGCLWWLTCHWNTLSVLV